VHPNTIERENIPSFVEDRFVREFVCIIFVVTKLWLAPTHTTITRAPTLA
jgi:hypothetical protein